MATNRSCRCSDRTLPAPALRLADEGEMRRDWTSARAKVDAEGDECRVCGQTPAEAAHLIARSHVRPGLGEADNNIVPLCRRHHTRFDLHRFDLLPYLTFAEQAHAVSLVGILTAMERLTGQRYQEDGNDVPY